jgi:hypothetical protein
MSGHTLPDDPDRWPDNPCELLGVPFGGALRDLRRAYTRLIRNYKPEQYPEQFRLIRAAYDCLLPFARRDDARNDSPDASGPAEVLRSCDDGPHDESAPPADDTPPETITVFPREVVPAGEEARFSPAPSLEDEIEALWDGAVGGDAAAAYRRLAELGQQYAGKVDIYQRLWWLLTCSPALGGRDVPADWLARGLRATGLAGPLRELYREVVEADPAEAFTDRYSFLLTLPAAAHALAELLEWRIRSAARLDKWDVIAADVRRLGDFFRCEDEKLWLRILFALTDCLAWEGGATSGNLLKECRAEIKRYEYLCAEFSGAYDRFDLLMAVSPAYQALLRRDDVPGDMLEIVRLARTGSFTELRPLLKAILGQVARDPHLWLLYFDRVHAKSSGILALFGHLLEQYESDLESSRSMLAEPATVAELIREFLARSGESSYQRCRGQLLELCLREALTPEQVVEVAPSLPGAWGTAGGVLARAVNGDWPLRYASKAWHLFWV